MINHRPVLSVARRPLWTLQVSVALTVALCAALVGVVATPAEAQPGQAGQAGQPERVIVQLVPGADPETEARRAEANGARVLYTYRTVFPGFAAGVPEQAMAGLRNNPRVASIEKVSAVSASITQSPVVWGLDRIDQRTLPLSGSFTYPATGSGVSAYVVDTGIAASHVDFAGRVRSGYTAIGDGRGTSDCNGHGTHVSGTVAGTTYGVAKNATPVAVRVLDCSGSGYTDGVIAGLDWVASDHQPGVPAVANLSLGGPASSALDTAVQAVVNDGVTVSLAAGNSNVDACTTSPARAPAALTVGASDKTDTRASFSNYGPCLDLFAPGVGIVSDWYTSTTATASLSGTSMAAPHVAGAAAVLLSQERTLTPAQVASRLLGSSTTSAVINSGNGSANRLLYLPNTAAAVPLAVGNPGSRTATVGTATSLQMTATGGTAPYTWASTGLPAGVAINAGTGLITGTPSTAGTASVTVTARDGAGTTASTSFSWTVNPAATSCPAGQRLSNAGFESGAVSWTAGPGLIGQPGTRQPPRTGTWNAWLGGNGFTGTETLSQQVSIPAGCTTVTLSFWLHVDTAETNTRSTRDILTVSLGSATAATYSNLDRSTGYVERRLTFTGLAGSTVLLKFTATENNSRQTSFVLDDTALTVS